MKTMDDRNKKLKKSGVVDNITSLLNSSKNDGSEGKEFKFSVLKKESMEEGEKNKRNFSFLRVDSIRPSQTQPRKNFNEDSLTELAESIKAQGILQPILVRQLPNGYYEIIAGERRWRSAQIAGLKKVPAFVEASVNVLTVELGLIENIQRENLSVLEEASAYLWMCNEYGYTHEEVAQKVGKSRSSVSNLLRLLELEDSVKQLLQGGKIEMGHARSLLSLSPENQIKAVNIIINKGLNVRETERLVSEMQQDKEESDDSLTPSVLLPEFNEKSRLWTQALSQRLSTKVDVKINNKGCGKLVIHFESPDEVDWLVRKLEE